MVNVLVNENSLSAIADAIRQKAGTEDTYKPAEMAQAIADIPTGGNTIDERNNGTLTDATLTGDIVEQYLFVDCASLKNVNLTGRISGTIKDHAFERCTGLETVTGPQDESDLSFSVGKYAFNGCTSLSRMTGIKVKSPGEGAFLGCHSLKRLYFVEPVGTIGQQAFSNSGIEEVEAVTGGSNASVGAYAFSDCTQLKTVSFEGYKTIGMQALKGCSSLEAVNVPNATQIQSGAFLGTTLLKRIDAPACTQFSGYSVNSSAARTEGIEIINLPLCPAITQGSFYNLQHLRAVNAPECTSIGNAATSYYRTFSGCTSLEAVIITKRQLVSLASSNYIPATVTFYVNDDFYNAYLTATNWAAIASQIKPYSECPAEIKALFE